MTSHLSPEQQQMKEDMFEAGRRKGSRQLPLVDDVDPSTLEVLALVATERQSQEARYGATNDLVRSGTGPHTAWLLPYTSDGAAKIQSELRMDYEDWEDEEGLPTWVHLVREELAEAFELPEGHPNLVPELVQVAALCVSWVERLLAKEDNE